MDSVVVVLGVVRRFGFRVNGFFLGFYVRTFVGLFCEFGVRIRKKIS